MKRPITAKRIDKANLVAKRARNSSDKRKAKRALRLFALLIKDSEDSAIAFNSRAWARRQMRRYFRLSLRGQR